MHEKSEKTRLSDSTCLVKDRAASSDRLLETLLTQVRACRVCSSHLPLEPRPMIRASTTAKLLIVGQAPGIKVHNTGIPWNDRSGDRLRSWLGLERERFYNKAWVAIMPMGFCYPGIDKQGGDKPPRPECAPLWHASIRRFMPNIQLTLLVGSYAQRYYLGKSARKTLHETVQNWQAYQPDFFPLPHPSWRNTAWLKRNPWFEEQVLPKLQEIVNYLCSKVI